MPPHKCKPVEIAVKAKNIYIPYIKGVLPQFLATSHLYPNSATVLLASVGLSTGQLCIMVINSNAVNVALDWYKANVNKARSTRINSIGAPSLPQILVLNMANDKHTGGNWEAGLLVPKECFCWCSNLIIALTSIIVSMCHLQYPLGQ